MRLARLTATIAAPTVVAWLVAGCVPSTVLPQDCDASSVTRQATLSGEQLVPSMIEVCRDQQVRLSVTVERDGILHLHGYDDQTPAVEVRAGETKDLAFTAVRAGQFPVALHTTDGPAEATVGTLIVHEP